MEYFKFYQKFHELDIENINPAGTKPFDSFFQKITQEKIDHQVSKDLTSSERKICVGLALGLTAKEIARARGSSNRTVETHIANIKMKVGCKRLPPILLMRLMAECPLPD